MRLFALTVGRNERYRYLSPMLAYMKDVVDEHFFFDDQSNDGTEKLAELGGCEVCVRVDGVPGFVENEGAFRQEAWATFESMMDPQPGDWVLVIDCDEVLVSTYDNFPVREAVEAAIKAAATTSSVSITLDIPEVFAFDPEDRCPLVRVDRLWGTIHAPRLFRYQPGGTYYQEGYGVPAVPSYVMASPTAGSAGSLALMHYGYARQSDQQIKYQRYSGRGGHSNEHVQSILAADKELIRWDHPYAREMGTWTQSILS